jgi:hypothetical protein
MGSFNATCIVSNLPIEAGDPVRFLALTENDLNRSNEHCCYVTGRWQPRTAAIRACYNDYGSIEKIQEGLVERVFFKSFNADVIEKGVGDNQCHDVQVRKGMTREQWLEALWEGRVFVGQEVFQGGTWKPREDTTPKGIPTLARIENVLRDGHLSVVTEYGADGFVLDDVTYGYIRVRNSGYLGNEEGMKALGDALMVIRAADYAAMLTCGTGSYSHPHGEILVAPMPADRVSLKGLNPEERRKPERPVTQAMVREDVWQILLGMKLKSWGEKSYTVEAMKEWARKTLAEDREFKRQNDAEIDDIVKVKAQLNRIMLREDLPDNLFRGSLRGSEGVSGFYFRQAYDLGVELAKSDAELDAFVEDLAEMVFAQWAYSSLHGQWHPTTNSGQDGNWGAHREFLLNLAEIKGKWEDDEEMGDDEDDEADVSEAMQALIRWRSEQVLDFSDDDEYICKVQHGLTSFYQANPELIPEEHRVAYRDFMTLDQDTQWKAVEITLEIVEQNHEEAD